MAKTYTIGFSRNLLAGAGESAVFDLVLSGRKITLKHILITRRLFDVFGAVYIPEETNTTQNFFLRVGAPGAIFTNGFDVSGVIPAGKNGTYIEIWRPGDYYFNWSDFNGIINFSLNYGNGSGVTVQHNIDLLVEVDDKIIYF